MLAYRIFTHCALAALGAGLIACDSASSDAAPTEKAAGGSQLDAARAKILERSAEDVTEIKAAIASGDRTSSSCAGALGRLKQYRDGKDVPAPLTEQIQALDQLCGYDAPLAALEKAVAGAEEARKADPEARRLSECYSAEKKGALRTLEPHSADEKVKALLARWDVACPPK